MLAKNKHSANVSHHHPHSSPPPLPPPFLSGLAHSLFILSLRGLRAENTLVPAQYPEHLPCTKQRLSCSRAPYPPAAFLVAWVCPYRSKHVAGAPWAGNSSWDRFSPSSLVRRAENTYPPSSQVVLFSVALLFHCQPMSLYLFLMEGASWYFPLSFHQSLFPPGWPRLSCWI